MVPQGITVLVTPPAGPALTLDEAKMHLRVTFYDDDDLIGSYIDAATESLDGIEGFLGRGIVDQVWRFDIARFCGASIDLPLGGVSEIESVTYIDVNGVSQTLATSVYTLVSDRRFTARIELKPGQSWPATQVQSQAVSISFKTGFGPSETSVPKRIKQALKLMVGDMYRVREAFVDRAMAENAAASSLVSSYRRPTL